MQQYYSYQQLYHYISQQDNRIKNLEKLIAGLQQEVSSLKEKPSINVERIEYKFDQLKVETLEGTLNIGLNPSDLENSIEDFAVKDKVPSPYPVPPVPQGGDLENMQKVLIPRIEDYIEKDVPVIISDTELQLGTSIDASYHQLIKEDIRKQIPQRIQFYLQSMPVHQDRNTSDVSWEDKIFSKVKNDINTAIFSFMSNLPENLKGAGNNEPASDQP
ncbi:spore germination protein GerPC [Bacillus sp. AK031]